jgi:hypothetical protein
VWFDPRWFDLCSGFVVTYFTFGPNNQKNQKNPIFVPKKNKQIIQISRHCHFVCLNLSGPSNPAKMVKSRITASRRLRAQVKKHQKTRRGGHNGFSPRLRELNSGDVPWEMPSGGKSKFQKKEREKSSPSDHHNNKKSEREQTYVAQTFSMSTLDVVFCHLFSYSSLSFRVCVCVIVTWPARNGGRFFFFSLRSETFFYVSAMDWSGCLLTRPGAGIQSSRVVFSFYSTSPTAFVLSKVCLIYSVSFLFLSLMEEREREREMG